MVWRGSRRYGLVIGLIFTTVRHIAREYKGIVCRGSPVPLCKGTGTKQLKVDYFDCATCVLQFADSLLYTIHVWVRLCTHFEPAKVITFASCLTFL
jgi:hypothetical protein